MTQERADILSEYLAADEERAKRLLGLEPDAALAEINAAGYDFTPDELQEYCVAFKAAVVQNQNGELSVDELSEVSGGLVLTTALAVKVGVGLLTCFGVGAGIGIAAGAKW